MNTTKKTQAFLEKKSGPHGDTRLITKRSAISRSAWLSVLLVCSLFVLLLSTRVSLGQSDAGSSAGSSSQQSFQTDIFTGRFSYSIPITIPPARQGSEPKISLGYNSSGGNSWCGIGWNLDMGFIQRETRKGVPVKWGTTTPLQEYDDANGFSVSFAGVSAMLVNVGGKRIPSPGRSGFLEV